MKETKKHDWNFDLEFPDGWSNLEPSMPVDSLEFFQFMEDRLTEIISKPDFEEERFKSKCHEAFELYES